MLKAKLADQNDRKAFRALGMLVKIEILNFSQKTRRIYFKPVLNSTETKSR
jgi:hypothetical protein